MEDNEGRRKYIKEMMIDDLSRNEPYTHSAITSALDKYFMLKFKIENNELLKKNINDKLDFYRSEIKNKITRFQRGEPYDQIAKDIKSDPHTENLMIQNQMGQNMRMGMGNGMGMGTGMGYGMGMGTGMGYGMGTGMGYGMGMGVDPGMMLGGYGMGYDPYMMPGMGMGMGMGMGIGTGMGMGMPMAGQINPIHKKVWDKTLKNIPKLMSNFEKYNKLEQDIVELNKNIDELLKERTHGNEVQQKEKEEELRATKQRIEEYEEKKNKILKTIEDSLYETILIKDLEKDLSALEISPNEMLEYERLQVFFRDILGFDESKLDECNDNIYVCFNEEYKKAKQFVEHQKTKFDVIISKYIELIERSLYDYNEDKFIKYMKYIKRKILLSSELFFDDYVNIDDYKPENIKEKLMKDDIYEPIPETFDFADIKSDDIDKIPKNKFVMFKPHHYASMLDNQLLRLLPQQLMYFTPQGIDALGKRLNVVLDNMHNKGNLGELVSNNPNFYKHLSDENLNRMYKLNPGRLNDVLNPEDLKRIDLNALPKDNPMFKEHIEKLIKKSGKIFNNEEIREVLKIPDVSERILDDMRYDPSHIKNIDFNDLPKKNVENFVNSNRNILNLLSDNQILLLMNNEVLFKFLDTFQNARRFVIENKLNRMNFNDAPRNSAQEYIKKNSSINNVEYLQNFLRLVDPNLLNILVGSNNLWEYDELFHNIQKSSHIIVNMNKGNLNEFYKKYVRKNPENFNKFADFLHNPDWRKTANSLLIEHLKEVLLYSKKPIIDIIPDLIIQTKVGLLNAFAELKINNAKSNRHNKINNNNAKSKKNFTNNFTKSEKYSREKIIRRYLMLDIIQKKDRDLIYAYNKLPEDKKKIFMDSFNEKEATDFSQMIQSINTKNRQIPGTRTSIKLGFTKPVTGIPGTRTGIKSGTVTGMKMGGYEIEQSKSDNRSLANTLIENEKINFEEYKKIIDKETNRITELLKEFNKNESNKEDLIATLDKLKLNDDNSLDQYIGDIQVKSRYFTKEANNYTEGFDKYLIITKGLYNKFKTFRDDIQLKKFFSQKDIEMISLSFQKTLKNTEKNIDECKSIIKRINNYIGGLSGNKRDNNYNAYIPPYLRQTNQPPSIVPSNTREYNKKIEGYKDELEAITGKLIVNNDMSLKDSITKLSSIYSKLFNSFKSRNKTAISRAAELGEDDEKFIGESMYTKIWNKYVDDVNDEEKIMEETQDRFHTRYKSHNLDPNQALSLTRDDKILFIIIVFLIRQISLTITESFIDNGMITNLLHSLIIYYVIYAFIIILIVLIINIDDYKLRIVFNFFNMHVNGSGIFGHLFMVFGLIFIMYYLLYSISPESKTNKKELSEVDKLKLVYKLELLTIAVFAFVAICDFLIP